MELYDFGNLQNWSTNFQALVAAGTIQGGSYTISAKTISGAQSLEVVTINLNCPTAKNYEAKLKTLHGIMVTSMKAKQSVDLQHVEKLSTLIEEFELLYFKKEAALSTK